MADEDGYVKITTEIDDSGIDQGLANIKQKIKDAAASVSQSVNAAANTTKNAVEDMLDTTAKTTQKTAESTQKSVKKAADAIEEETKDAAKTADTNLKKMSASAEKNKKSWADIGGMVSTADTAFSKVSGAIDTVVKTISECTSAYREQEKAERALSVAIGNNPYVDGSAAVQIKDFAYQLQQTSEISDQMAISMGTMLIASGKDAEQSMLILQTAADLAAGSTMEFEQAVEALNASFTGSAGELEDLAPELANLTEEQLRAGDAVDLLSKKFQGFAEQSADAGEQLKNTFSTFKEEVGARFEAALTPVKNFFNELISGWNDALKAKREYNDAKEINEAGEGTTTTIKTQLDIEREKLESFIKMYEDWTARASGKSPTTKPTVSAYLSGGTSDAMSSGMNDRQQIEAKAQAQAALERVKMQRELIAGLEEEYRLKEQIEKAEAEDAAQAAAQAAAQEEKNRLDKEALEHIAANEAALNKQLEAMEIQARLTGETVTNYDKFNVMLASYVSLITESNGLVTEGNQYAQKRLEILKELGKEAQKEQEGTRDDTDSEQEKTENTAADAADDKLKQLQEAFADITVDDERTLVQSLEDQLADLDALYADVVDTTELTEEKRYEIEQEYAEKRMALEKQIAEAKKAAAIDTMEETTALIASTTSQLESTINSATSLAQQSNEAETERELSNLATQYTEGIISYEEYVAKKEQIDRQAARKQYQLDMFNWTASLLTATANIAQGVAKAIAQGGVAGIITGALVGAAGAIQIATIAANKPKPPSFAAGGIVPGRSYSGDNVQANVNSGEMILNAQQQRNLWDVANARGHGTQPVVNMPITIENNASDQVSAQPQLSEHGLRVVIDQIVNTSMQQGHYTQSMRTAQNKEKGIAYL